MMVQGQVTWESDVGDHQHWPQVVVVVAFDNYSVLGLGLADSRAREGQQHARERWALQAPRAPAPRRYLEL